MRDHRPFDSPSIELVDAIVPPAEARQGRGVDLLLAVRVLNVDVHERRQPPPSQPLRSQLRLVPRTLRAPALPALQLRGGFVPLLGVLLLAALSPHAALVLLLALAVAFIAQAALLLSLLHHSSSASRVRRPACATTDPPRHAAIPE